MRSATNFTSKEVALGIENIEELRSVAHALSTELRLNIVRYIASGGKSINELARALAVPVSTVALNVQVLEKAGLIVCDTQPGARGTLKLCNRRIDRLMINLSPELHQEAQRRTFSMPVGGFVRVGDVAPTCGLAAAEGPYGMDDAPEAFYHPHRFGASLMWMREGFVEYAFPKVDVARLETLEVGNNCFLFLTTVSIRGLPRLASVVIGEKSFSANRDWKRRTEGRPDTLFEVAECPQLRRLWVG